MKITRKIILGVLVCAGLLVNGAFAFSDTENFWAKDAINYVSEKGLIEGVSEFSFLPQLTVSRAAFINALYKLTGSPSVEGVEVSGVPSDAVYIDAAKWAVKEKLVTGEFDPDSPLPRQQLATLLYRYCRLRGDNIKADGPSPEFRDAQDIRAYAKEAMDWCVRSGILAGSTDGCVYPQKTATRAEAAVIIERYAKLAGINVEDEKKPKPDEEYVAFNTLSGAVARKLLTERTIEGAVHESLQYSDTTGCTVSTVRVTSKAPEVPGHIAVSVKLNGGSGTVRWYDLKTKKWNMQELSGSVNPKGMYFVIMDSGEEAVFVTPQTYTDHGNSMLEYLPSKDGTLSVRKTDTGFEFCLNVPALANGEHADMLAVTSKKRLIDWTDPGAGPRWANYNLTGDNRWCFNGYYYLSPSSYYPYGNNYYYSLPAAHIMGKMLKNPNEPASRVIGLMMLDTMQTQQNGLGFIPSKYGSTWLLDEFGIGPGFYDTRFNTDFWLACVNAMENFGADKWMPAAEKYADFFIDFAEKHHHKVSSGNREGWLVEDYWSPYGGKSTHTSLNHQASEASLLYRLAKLMKNEDYAVFADKMVAGIELTENKWIMPDGNLYYSYYPDGTMRDGDYPDLTYNDLIGLNRLYSERHGKESEAISHLCKSKYGWMLKNGVVAAMSNGGSENMDDEYVYSCAPFPAPEEWDGAAGSLLALD